MDPTRSDFQRKITKSCLQQDAASVEILLAQAQDKTLDLSKAYMACIGHANSTIAQCLTTTTPPTWNVLEEICIATANGFNASMFEWVIEQMKNRNLETNPKRTKRFQRACATAALVAVRAPKGYTDGCKILTSVLPHVSSTILPQLCVTAIKHDQKSSVYKILDYTCSDNVRTFLDKTPLPKRQKMWAESALNKHQNAILLKSVSKTTNQPTKRKL